MGVLNHELESAWVRAIQTVRLIQSGSGYKILVKAMGQFSPRLIDGADTFLFLRTRSGKWAVISGKLKIFQDQSMPRGMWFTYVFEPRKKGLLQTLQFAGRNQFSNVKTIWLRFYTENNYFCSNPWFRTPAALQELKTSEQDDRK